MKSYSRSRVLAWLAALLAVVAMVGFPAPQPANAGLTQFWDNFESTSHPNWWGGPGTGFDYNAGLAHGGVGNGWINTASGWSALNTVVGVYPHSDCVASAWLRLSSNLTGGYMSVRYWNGQPGNVISEIQLVGPGPYNPAHGNYNQYVFHFNPGNNGYVLFYVGLWGNGTSAWIQVDDVIVQCPTPY